MYSHQVRISAIFVVFLVFYTDESVVGRMVIARRYNSRNDEVILLSYSFRIFEILKEIAFRANYHNVTLITKR